MGAGGGAREDLPSLRGLGAALEAHRRHSKAFLGSMDGPKMLRGTCTASLAGPFGALRGVLWGALRVPSAHSGVPAEA